MHRIIFSSRISVKDKCSYNYTHKSKIRDSGTRRIPVNTFQNTTDYHVLYFLYYMCIISTRSIKYNNLSSDLLSIYCKKETGKINFLDTGLRINTYGSRGCIYTR